MIIVPSNVGGAAGPVEIRGHAADAMPTYAAGDLLVYIGSYNQNYVPNTPIGYTSAFAVSSASGYRARVSWKIATASESMPSDGINYRRTVISFIGGKRIGGASGFGVDAGLLYVPSLTLSDATGNSMVIGYATGNMSYDSMPGFTMMNAPGGINQYYGFSRSVSSQGTLQSSTYGTAVSFEVMNN